MKYLSLFSGVEGGGLAFQHLIEPKITCIGYVENDEYCQRIIRQRQIDGLLDKAPIYGDIRTFIDSGCAELYRGITDIVAGGFPCQPFSQAGKRTKELDDRNLWPETIATIRLVRPRYTFLENVPGLLTSGYMPTIFADLAEAGYNARWTMLGANDVGAKHKRKRVWILAHTNRDNEFRISKFQQIQNSIWERPKERASEFLGMDARVDKRVDRFSAIGNGQAPQVAALAWEILKSP